jgi:hypothetical protein
MSLRASGKYRCDRCDQDVGNGAVTEAAVVVTLLSDLEETEDLTPITLHFCRIVRDGYPRGCAGRVLSASNTEAYRASKVSA